MSIAKPIDFTTYKKLQKMSPNAFNHWLMDICSAVYDKGSDSVKSECVAALTEDKLMEILLSVKGIGRNRAEQVVEKVLAEGYSYYGA